MCSSTEVLAESLHIILVFSFAVKCDSSGPLQYHIKLGVALAISTLSTGGARLDTAMAVVPTCLMGELLSRDLGGAARCFCEEGSSTRSEERSRTCGYSVDNR